MKTTLNYTIVILLKDLKDLNQSVQQLFAQSPKEVCAVYDFGSIQDIESLKKISGLGNYNLNLIKSKFPNLPGKAIIEGMTHAHYDRIVVVMGDRCDNWNDIPLMVSQLSSNEIVTASRLNGSIDYLGGNKVKELITRLAAKLLAYRWGWKLKDPTNNFKAYRKDILEILGPFQSKGFEIGIEFLVKAHKKNLRILEINSMWSDDSKSYQWMQRISSYLPYLIKDSDGPAK